MIDYKLINTDKDETIIFVHGLASNLNSFVHSIDHFKNSYRILALSMRGHGNSPKTDSDNLKDYCVKEMADDVLEIINKLDIKKFHYVGHSMGGIIGYELIGRNSDQFITFTACGSPAYVRIPEWIAMASTSPLTVLPENILASIGGKFIARFSGKTPGSRRILREDVVPYINWTVMRNCLVNLSNISYLNVIKEIETPFFLVHGQYDVYNIYIKPILKIMEGKENFRYEYMKGAGHNAHIDFPDKFNKMLEEFINKSK